MIAVASNKKQPTKPAASAQLPDDEEDCDCDE